MQRKKRTGNGVRMNNHGENGQDNDGLQVKVIMIGEVLVLEINYLR